MAAPQLERLKYNLSLCSGGLESSTMAKYTPPPKVILPLFFSSSELPTGFLNVNVLDS